MVVGMIASGCLYWATLPAMAGDSLFVLDLAIKLLVDGGESCANDGQQVAFGLRIAFDVDADLTCLVVLDHHGPRRLEFHDHAMTP